MGHENLENRDEAQSFDFVKAIENDPVAQWLSEETYKLYSDPMGEKYNNMVNFMNWLKVNKPEAKNTLYFHILIGSTPRNQPEAADLDGEYSIEKFVRDGFPKKDLKKLE